MPIAPTHTHARPPPYPLLSSSTLSYLSIYNSSPSGFGFAHRYSAAQPSSRSSWVGNPSLSTSGFPLLQLSKN
ncbi:hypothetical protein B296_00012778 [Ensete ventricosum]|uniref:Uncharacterized protein n=1 Tax=Ensete ventricosum TaxID=4639 RepID=A0A426YTD3_ENSVE|nr:hypothetical protein B296_00012778 [Ensete ventricosum]